MVHHLMMSRNRAHRFTNVNKKKHQTAEFIKETCQPATQPQKKPLQRDVCRELDGGHRAAPQRLPSIQPKNRKNAIENNNGKTKETKKKHPPVPASSAMEEELYRQSIKRLTFHAVLGEGAFGKVVLASHEALQQKLAVKIIKKRKLLCDIEEITTERKILHKFRNNPYITKLYGTFQTETHLFLAMEFLSGGDLRKLIETSAPLKVNTIRRLTAEIICCLQSLHAGGVIHRDLKPENILLDSEGHVRIADFGLSKSDVLNYRKIRGFVGTKFYTAPEVIEDLSYTTTADYFSLGLIVYEMALGKHPLHNDIQKEGKDAWKKIPTMTPHYPKDMDSGLHYVLVMLLCVDQDERARLVRDIRRNPFFKKIDWAEVEKRESPPAFRPEPIVNEQDYFTTDMEKFMACEDRGIPLKKKDQDKFKDFSYICESLKQKLKPSPHKGKNNFTR